MLQQLNNFFRKTWIFCRFTFEKIVTLYITIALIAFIPIVIIAMLLLKIVHQQDIIIEQNSRIVDITTVEK